MKKQWSRTVEILGEKALNKLEDSHVLIFGIGGVGSYAIEALVRSGIGFISIVDNQIVDETNINRQLIATRDVIGKSKVEVMRERILSINPDCKVEIFPIFFLPDTSSEIDFSRYDYVVDAVDTITAKIEIIEQAKKVNVPIISCMGTGNKLDPTMFEVADIFRSSICPLAKVMRRELMRRKISNVKVVFSKERPKQKQSIGSVSFVPSVAGLIMAGEVVKDLISS